MKKVLVTGANGYIGKHVVKNLLDIGYDVYACDIKFDNLDDNRVKKLNIPIFSEEKNIYEKLGKPDLCIHLAWRNGFVHNSDTHMEDLSKHYIFLKDMIEGGLKNLAIMGSMHEIGYWEGEIDENTPTNPLSIYGVAKNCLRQAMEIICKEKNINFKWFRAYYIIGDDLKSNSIFSKLMKMEMQGEKEFPFTTGENKYDFINIEELSKQIVIGSIQNEINGIINCCSGNPISLGEKVEEFIRENKLNIKLKYGVYPNRSYDSPAIWGNNDKIKYILSKYDKL